MSKTSIFNHCRSSMNFGNFHVNDDTFMQNVEDVMDFEYTPIYDDDTCMIEACDMVDMNGEISNITAYRYEEDDDVVMSTAGDMDAKMDALCHGMFYLGLDEDPFMELIRKLSKMTILDEMDGPCSNLSVLRVESDRYVGAFMDQWKAIVQYFALAQQPAICLVGQ